MVKTVSGFNNLTISNRATLNTVVANGNVGTAGQLLTSNGSTTYWSTVTAGSVNTSAQYTWTNLHTFSANVAFTGNGIGLTTNTAAIYLGGLADNNWKIGRNTGSTTKWRYTNNSIDVITANSNLEGFAIGLISGNSYFETGYLGTFIAANVTIGNSSSNSTINSTAFSGSANNTTYVNGKTEGNLNVNSALTSNNSTNLGGTAAASYQLNSTLNANTASYLPTYTGVVNGSSHTVGTAFTANATLTNTVSLVVSTNTSTFGTTVYIVANGNVGIGNSTPADKLVVAGSIIPSLDNSYNLGSASLRWANLYTGDLHLSNEKTIGNIIDGTTGNWTIQEGETELYIINNKNGKKFKFKLEEI